MLEFKTHKVYGYVLCRKVFKIKEFLISSRDFAEIIQRVKNREGKIQIFSIWAGQSGQIFLAGYFWAVRKPHRWQHMCVKVKMYNLL